MKKLKAVVLADLQKLSLAALAAILVFSLLFQTILAQGQARDNAEATFAQIHQILQENQTELAAVEEEYRQTCLLNAEAIAYIIQHRPEVLGDVQEFRKIARLMGVDEIHLFDQTGRIFTGSHPEYYDFTFDTGEQIGFFRPLLEDKNLKLCQDITPNTAEGKLVQYSALWSPDGQFIVQVGMYPEAVLEATEKNELSYIFSLLQGNPGVDLYAVNSKNSKIEGCTTGGDNGKQMSQIGLRMEDMDHYRRGAHVTVSGVDSYVVFTDMDGILVGYVISCDLLYRNVPLYTGILVLVLAIITVIFVLAVWHFNNRHILRSIDSINAKLRSVSAGDLDERMDPQSTLEFSELSTHINDMIMSLLASTDKMSFILNRTRIPIGVYEYNQNMRTARFTEYIPRLLNLDRHDLSRRSLDAQLLLDHIDRLRQSPVSGEKDVFLLQGSRDTYLKLEEITSSGNTLGIVMDVTQEITTRRQIEAERDVDLLTGLYNRRGMDRQLAEIFRDPDQPGYGTLVLMDSDGLKGVNDSYGHAVGDEYIRQIARRIRNIGSRKQLAARLGGDEFVLLLYGYPDEQSVYQELEAIRRIQRSTFLSLENGRTLQVHFSFGYVMIEGRQDYETMLEEADRYMYAVKRKRYQTQRELPQEPPGEESQVP